VHGAELLHDRDRHGGLGSSEDVSQGSRPDARLPSQQVGCLRICCHGPTLVVYPEGTWYHGMTADRVPRFVQEHLVEGRPIHEWIFAENPL
jgi:(2Fe-2S) ferredoxin